VEIVQCVRLCGGLTASAGKGANVMEQHVHFQHGTDSTSDAQQPTLASVILRNQCFD